MKFKSNAKIGHFCIILKNEVIVDVVYFIVDRPYFKDGLKSCRFYSETYFQRLRTNEIYSFFSKES